MVCETVEGKLARHMLKRQEDTQHRLGVQVGRGTLGEAESHASHQIVHTLQVSPPSIMLYLHQIIP
jgi:hypothetical protein